MPDQTDPRAYPDRPYLGVSALIIEGQSLLLVQRGNEPNKGLWSLPGGAVETGERMDQAICREVREETGLEIIPVHVGEMMEIIRHDDEGACRRHFVIAVFAAHAEKKPPIAGDDAMDARWVEYDALKDYALTDGTADLIERMRQV